MRVGIVILPEHRWSENMVRWKGAEEYGFDHAWTYDHLGLSWGSFLEGPWFDALTTLTAAAMVTTSIRLGTFVSSPNFRLPVPYARQLLSVDDVSGGRFTLGTGSGGAGYDRAVMGIPELSPNQRTARFAEFVELLDRLLREPRVDFQGLYYKAVDARNTPGCVQQPRIPFLVAANGPKAMRVAARFGQGWLTGPIAGEMKGSVATELDGWYRQVGELVKIFDETLAAEGRPRDSVDRFLTLDGSPLLSMSSVQAFEDHVGRARELGFTDVVTHWPRREGIYEARMSVLERIAADVLPRLRAR
jgi:alkanesulfonate monooxygenase SsuD/methylene tetrahydromethanopterin reductase-like flavin-dependent oxidoreductase (luciferase family)